MIVVVFPVPGPPVMTSSPQRTASITAFFCIPSSTVPVSCSMAAIFFSITAASISPVIFKSASIRAVLISI